MNEFLDYAKTQGLPSALLLALVYMVWRIARWLAPLIAELIAAHREFLTSTVSKVDQITDIVARTDTNVKKLLDRQRPPPDSTGR